MGNRAIRKLPVSKPMGDALIEDVKFLLDNNIHRERIATAVGRSSWESLVRTLQRYGEYELASQIQKDPTPAAVNYKVAAPITHRELRNRHDR